MKKITIGIIAHVDSGKTTLSEALLYLTGSIRSFGRVDKGSSFLDHEQLERQRGITIYSKLARFSWQDTSFVLIDTPGHSDFSAETERTLQALDYAILLISAADGIKGQTKVLWELLERYQVPVFLFVNKMDQPAADRAALLREISALTKDAVADFSGLFTLSENAAEDPGSPSVSLHLPEAGDAFYERIAVCSEAAMEEFLDNGLITENTMLSLIAAREMFPLLYGSALHMNGIYELLAALDRFTQEPIYGSDFAARVYKVGRDEDGSRLTFVKITGGTLHTKDLLPDGNGQSKIQQIRFYSGTKYQMQETAVAGDICTLTGLKESFAGQRFGASENETAPLLVPVLSYRVLTDDSDDPVTLLPLLKQIEEESPELSVTWEEEKKEIYVFVMGLVQLEILKTVVKERFGRGIAFDSGEVMYKETIAEPVIGVGHFEPLRHYAEVHLLMEPLPAGSGLQYESILSTDKLAKNWQRLIFTHLQERRHKGVLTGSPITDIKFTLTAGKAHLKHTEGGDFRQAVYRAVRQGLMMAENVLLEPFYRFTLEVPSSSVGKALSDLDRIHADFSAPEQGRDPYFSVINGRGPVAALKDYPAEIAAYTKGQGMISFITDGYGPCHNAEEVMLQKRYDPERDLRNPADSVFCSGGAGHTVPYYEVYDHMHLSFDGSDNTADEIDLKAASRTVSNISLGTEEVNAIIAKVAGANKKEKKTGTVWKKKFGEKQAKAASIPAFSKSVPASAPFSLEESDFVVVDGYNVIFAWEELTALARENIDAARDSLIDALSKYRSMVKAEVIAVFDAYRVAGQVRENGNFQNIRIIYTKEDETADQYIERFTNENSAKSKISVVTSDGAEQIITRGQGCRLVSSREFKNRIEDLSKQLNEKFKVQS